MYILHVCTGLEMSRAIQDFMCNIECSIEQYWVEVTLSWGHIETCRLEVTLCWGHIEAYSVEVTLSWIKAYWVEVTLSWSHIETCWVEVPFNGCSHTMCIQTHKMYAKTKTRYFLNVFYRSWDEHSQQPLCSFSHTLYVYIFTCVSI